ncbi:unnamed protein product [Paramecium pentaurelia]|uniref:Uncharacterized protein n=1 Tax=Paramecium pentaurelia TaxID=43138 RepID=A0A8S1VNE5_9CILI|nr:unnamed protein product [Paramecium pentaurelia]
MASKSIICTFQDGKQYYLQCDVLQVKNVLHRQINSKIPFDNIILIDDYDKVYSASTALYQTKNNQMQGQISYKVLDAQYLYREYKELIKINETNYEELLETQQKLQKLVEEMKEKEKSHKIEIQQLCETNKSQSADILRTKQAEIEKMKAEKDQEIQEIQDKHNRLELQLNQITNKCNAQDENIRQLQDDIQTQMTNNDKLQKKNEDLNNEINKINQDKTNLDQQWQTWYGQLNAQMEQKIQQIYQYQLAIQQTNNDYGF